jgi:hypothetical protein
MQDINKQNQQDPAKAASPEFTAVTDSGLAAQGWERRFVADAQRAAEVLELYHQLGFEVRAEPLNSMEISPECEDCIIATQLKYRTIYTRKLDPVPSE